MECDWEEEPERSGSAYGVIMTPIPYGTDPGMDHEDVATPRNHASTDHINEPHLNPGKPVPQVRERSDRQGLVVEQMHKRGIMLQWWAEIGAILLSAIGLLALVATLYPHNGKPLPQWPFSISVNALVSIYVSVAKASILFVTAEGLSQLKWIWYTKTHTLRDPVSYDEASRGTKGAMNLLWILQARDLLASSGALVMLFMLFVDPFTQQLLHYFNYDVVLDGSEAAVTRTTFLDGLGSTSEHVGANLASVPPSWQNAVNSGLFSPGQQASFTCPTGNCTLPKPYGIMAYCSNCQDVRDSLSVVNQTWTFNDTALNTTIDYWGWNTSLPSGTSVINMNDEYYLNYTTMSGAGENPYMEIVLGKTIDDGIDRALGQTQGCNDSTSAYKSWRSRGYGAARCYITPCVQLYNSSITLGSLEETLLAVSQDNEWGSFLYTLATLDVNCLSAEEREGLDKADYKIRDGQRWLAYNVTWDIYSYVHEDTGFPQSMSRHGCLYAYESIVLLSLWSEYLSGFFSGNLTGIAAAPEVNSPLTGPQSLQNLFNYSNTSFDRVDSIFHNMSESLTNLAHQTGSSNHSAADIGTVMHAQTCLEVQWQWLSFLAVTCFVAWVLFTATIMAHFRIQWLPAWKSSPLPLLFHGLAGQENGLTGDMDELERRTGQLRVQLTRSEEGLKLVDQ